MLSPPIALDFIEGQEDENPFFLYLAYNAPHWPLHAKEEDIARFEGAYSIGWDSVRNARFARQQSMGLLSDQWQLSPRDQRVRPWKDLTPGEQDSTAYRMAVYAAQISSVDQNIGRLIASLKAQGKYENTVFLFLSDNGGCAETYDELGSKPMSRINDPDFGGAVSYGIGWANASNTPFYEYKVRTFEGGISTTLIIHWPAGLSADKGSIRHEPAHLIDLMPTVLDLAGAAYPQTYHGGESILPIEGHSLMPMIGNSTYHEHEYLIWEHQSYQAVRKGKWKIVKNLDEEVWKLFDMESDRTETTDLASAHADIVTELSQQWDSWAAKKGVLPKAKEE